MFFRNKQWEVDLKELLTLSKKEIEDIKNQLIQFQEQWGQKDEERRQEAEKAANQQQGELKKLTMQLNGLDEGIKSNEKQIRRQSRSFEDLLEEMQEQQKEKEFFESLLKEKEQKEKELLSLVNCCRGQMELFYQQLQKTVFQDEKTQQAWQQQLHIMDCEVKKLMQQCGMEEVGEIGELVDYDYCQVLEAIDTTDENLIGKIANVYRRGRIYCGHVVTKAQVAAYRRRVNGS